MGWKEESNKTNPVCLLQCKSIPSPEVDPAIAQVLLLLETELLDLQLQHVGIHLAHSPSQHPRGKKPTDFDLLVVNFSPLKLPTSVSELLETRLPHSKAHAVCQGSTRFQMPPVICFNCYLNLTHFTMKQLMPR